MKNKAPLLLLLILAALFGLYYFKYYLGYAADLWSRPWAYSRDPAAKLLVGKWRGSFEDPTGVTKEISLEIFLPVTEEERQKRASRVRRRSGVRHRNKQAFDGRAIVESRLGEERYEVFGAVEKSDMHRLSLQFVAEDEAKKILPNDTLARAPSGRWDGDRLQLELAFSRQDAQGTSSTTSGGVVVNGVVVWQEDPADRHVVVELARAKPWRSRVAARQQALLKPSSNLSRAFGI
jgi:hypothetical protein